MNNKALRFSSLLSSGKQCGQLTGEHVGIGTCHVYVDVGLDIETVDKPLELFDILNLIQKDIVGLSSTSRFLIWV